MKDSQKSDHVSLANIVSSLREGRYVIPDFQRNLEWVPWNINELMRQSSVTTRIWEDSGERDIAETAPISQLGPDYGD